MKTKEGQLFEFQIHTYESFALKMSQHEDYDIERDPEQTVEAQQAAYDRIVERFRQARLPIPPGFEQLGVPKLAARRPSA